MRAPYRVIAITGASSGLGAALAISYAGPGVVLGLVARNRERLAQTEAACRAAGARVESAAIDVANTAAMTAWLGSDECSFSTGAVFDLSGGRATY